MIKRTGFVSNSSSSSFIVTFPHKPESKEDLADMMGVCHSLGYDQNRGSKEEVVDRVWNDLKNGAESNSIFSFVFLNDDENLESEYDLMFHLSSLMSDILYEFNWEDRESGACEIPALERFIEKIQTKINNTKLKNEDQTGFKARFRYSDEDGEGWLEHGDIFRNLPHERISHH